MSADYLVYCHADGHGHRASGDETPENTAWHRRSTSTLIHWPNDGGALWHCSKHADHTVQDGERDARPWTRTPVKRGPYVAEGRVPNPWHTIVTKAFDTRAGAAAEGRRLRLGGMVVRRATDKETER